MSVSRARSDGDSRQLHRIRSPPSERLTISEAISSRCRCAEEGARILGRRFVVIVPRDMAVLDLLLDTFALEADFGEAPSEA